VISTTSARTGDRRSESKGRISSPRPYIKASRTELCVSLERSESRVEPKVWRGRRAEQAVSLEGPESRVEPKVWRRSVGGEAVGGESGVCAEAWRSPELGASSRLERQSGERESRRELASSLQSEVTGPRRNPCIAEGRTGSDRASTLIEHQLLSSINSYRAPTLRERW